MSQDPDAALMLAFQRGDASAFRVLYERHASAMVGYCHRFVRNAARAEDAAVVASLDRLDPREGRP
jgi:DNA-directed RNA polymerase specialized sigma24 family protein